MAEPIKNDLREVAVRGLISNIVGPKWAPLADAGMTLIGNDAGEVYQKGKDFLGNVMGGYWERMGERPAKHAYERLTEKGAPTSQRPSRPADPFFNPDEDVIRKSTNFLGRQGGLERFIHENPEMTAEAVGATTAAAPLIAGGLFLNAFAQGSKPRSDYAYPVEPYRGGYDDNQGVSASSNEYNPSVESARAAARAREDLEILKQQHKKELIEMRGESHTPGVQGGGSYDVASMLDKLQSSRPNYF